MGVAASLVFTSALESLLFGVDPIDLPTFVAVIGTVLLVAILAASIPSWRAARLNAIEALGAE